MSLSGQVTRLSPPATSLSIIATSPARVYAAGSSLAALPSAFVLDLPTNGDAADGEGTTAEQALGPEVQSKWRAAGDVLAGLRLPQEAQALLHDISVTRRMSGKPEQYPPGCEMLPVQVCLQPQVES